MTGFQSTSPRELDAALEKLSREGMRALIWDLRGNPGGLLPAATSVLDRFIDSGVLVSTRGRSPRSELLVLGHAPPQVQCSARAAWSTKIAPVPAKSWPAPSATISRGTIVGRTDLWKMVRAKHLPHAGRCRTAADDRQVLFALRSQLHRRSESGPTFGALSRDDRSTSLRATPPSRIRRLSRMGRMATGPMHKPPSGTRSSKAGWEAQDCRRSDDPDMKAAFGALEGQMQQVPAR